MKEYREAVVVAQRRRQIRRLGVILTAIVVVFVSFVLGMMVGMQMERKSATWSPPDALSRQKIVMPAREPSRFPAPTSQRTEPSQAQEVPEASGTEAVTPTPRDAKPAVPKKEEDVKLTFYDTLTKKTPGDTVARASEKPRVSKPSTPEVKVPALKEGYYVYVASFQNREYAQTLRDRLAKGGYAVHVVPVELTGKGKWYRVTLGAYPTREEAERVKASVAKAEKIRDALVVLEK